MKNWSNAPTEKIIQLVNEAGGKLILHRRMLAVLIADEKFGSPEQKFNGSESFRRTDRSGGRVAGKYRS